MRQPMPMPMTMPMIALGLGMLLSASVGVLPGSRAVAASLKLDSIVSEDMIKVGDLFAGAERVADRPVARAPAPGGNLILDSRFLQRVAAANRIDWQPLDWQDQVVVRRASQEIGAPAIRAALSRALESQIPAGRIEIELDDERVSYHLPTSGAPAAVTVENVIYAGHQNRFSGVVTVSGGGVQQRVRVAGRAVGLMQVPVLGRWVKPGETITTGDLTWTEAQYSPNQGDMVLDPTVLIGKTPRRALTLGRPISERDVQAPRLVAKGSLVTLVLRSPRMQLTAQGKALQEGGKGDVITVVNTSSNRSIEAVVTGPGRVDVVSDRPLTH